MRSVVATVLELAGAGVVLGAAWAADPRLFAALAGVLLIMAGYLIAAPRRKG